MEFEGRARIRAHLDIAPLIDVVFLLLVFFMLTSTFIMPEAIDLKLPESNSAVPLDKMPIDVTLNAEGKITLNGNAVQLHELRDAVASLVAHENDQSITLKSDARTNVQQLLDVMDQLRAAGADNIALATMTAASKE
ncbi:MAG: biopolymer transporter ExbD [Gammaproteobacteria bacterium]|nr:biopolymer transporter ExbD [Gammaproteobacteria bacterium]